MSEKQMEIERKKMRTDIKIPQKAVNITAFIILCLMSLEPLKGVFVRFIELEDVYENFFLKSNLARGLGLIALVVGAFFIIMREKVSLVGTLKDIYYKKPWNICFTLVLLWTFVSYGFSKGKYISMYGDAFRYEGLIAYIAYAGFFGLASLVKSERLKTVWVHFTIAVSTVLAICSLISYYGGNKYILTYMNDKGHGTTGLAATFLQYNHYAYYLSMIILLLAGLFLTEKKKVRKAAYAVLLGFHQFVLAQNGTRGGYVAVFTVLILLTVLAKKKGQTNAKEIIIMWVICVLFSVISKTFLERLLSIFMDTSHIFKGVDADRAGSGRWKLWRYTLWITSEHPVIGCGPNMSYYFMSAKGLPDMPHNEYFQHLCELGIPGGGLYIGGLLLLFIDRVKKIKNLSTITMIIGCAAAAYAVSAFFGVTTPLVLPFFFILLGLSKEEATK